MTEVNKFHFVAFGRTSSAITHSVFNTYIAITDIQCNPTIRQPGFDLPRQQWSLLNRFHTEQGHCSAAEGNGDLQTLICVLVARPRRCLTLSTIVNVTHTRRRRLSRILSVEDCNFTIGKPWHHYQRASSAASSDMTAVLSATSQ